MRPNAQLRFYVRRPLHLFLRLLGYGWVTIFGVAFLLGQLLAIWFLITRLHAQGFVGWIALITMLGTFGLMDVISIVPCTIYTGMISVGMMLTLLNLRPAFTLTPEGVSDSITLLGRAFLPWRDVESLWLSRNSRIDFSTSKRRGTVSRQTWLIRFQITCFEKAGGHTFPFVLDATLLAMPMQQTWDTIQEYIAIYASEADIAIEKIENGFDNQNPTSAQP